MALEHRTDMALPTHRQPGGFDHAAVHRASARLYVAHTANDALDVIDCARDRYLHSIAGLTSVAGALVSDARRLVFTSNRGDHTVGIFAPDAEEALVKVPVGRGGGPIGKRLCACHGWSGRMPLGYVRAITRLSSRRKTKHQGGPM